MYNKRALNVDLGKFTKPDPYKDDILYTEQGQWEFPGQPTRIPSNDITMEGVPYPVYGIDNTGYEQMMYPGEDYTFPGDYVDEYPMAKRGGYMSSLPKKKSSKRYSRSLTATNKLFTKNPFFKNTRSKKNRVFDPNAKYYQDGGFHDDINKRRQVLRDWTYGKSIGMLQEPDGGYIELDLSEEEMDQYRKGGYIVEDLTQAQYGLSQNQSRDVKNLPEVKVTPNFKKRLNLTGRPEYAKGYYDPYGVPDNTLENILEIFDPSGLSSWDDVARSYRKSGMSPETALEVFGALPLIGKLGKLAKPGIHLKKYKGLDKTLYDILPKSKSVSKALSKTATAGRATDIYQAVDEWFKRNGGDISIPELNQVQKGGRAPIYTNDPNDPRLQAYRDSLTLHNQSVRDVNYIRSLKPGDPFKKNTSQEFTDARRRLNDPDFERTGTITNDYWTRGRNYGIYKKPTQPIYYKKSESKPKAVEPVASQSKPIEQIIPEPIQVENTPSVQKPLRDKMIMPLGRWYNNESATGSPEGGKTYYGEFEKIIDPSSGKIRYLPTGKKSNFTTLQDPTFEIGGFMVEDISVPTLTKAEYGMPMGTGMSQNYMGNTRTFYQTGGMLADKQYAAGGAASPKDLNPATMQKYKQDLKLQENSIKAGYNKAQDKWYPHASVEGGNKTIGYGHKLTNAEVDKFNRGITSGQVEELLTSDILKHQAIAENMIDKKYGKGAFDKLPQSAQMIFVDYAYNGVLGQFPTFTDAVVKRNKNLMLKEYERSSSGGKLTERNNWTRGIIEKNFQDGGPIELELTPEEIDWYISQGYEVEDLN